jgi:RNA polymerase sigma factor (sigma-70 family)
MSASSLRVTDLHLLDRLRDPEDTDAWGEFYRRYGRRIRLWCLRWGLQEVDADDLRQQILLKLLHKMKSFVYDPGRSFLAWLETLSRHTVYDFVRRRARTVKGAETVRVLDQIEAREDSARRREEQFDLELLETACMRVRRRVAPSTCYAFVAVAIEGQPPAEVASRTGLSVNQTYVAKRRVLMMLKNEVRSLQK